MRHWLFLLCCLPLLAATAQEVVPGLEANGYFIEEGSTASEETVSDAVFEGRAAGGRLYIVVLSIEPPGGATTFADSVLDDLVDGYVLVVAPETVGYAGDGSFWSSDELDRATERSLDGSDDDEVVGLFVEALAGSDGEPSQGGGGLGWVWLLVLVGGGALVVWAISRRSQAPADLSKVRELAKTKLAEVANDIIDLEDEVRLSEDSEVRTHYQRASATYARAMGEVETASTADDLMRVAGDLDLAIWELDCAEALLDSKPLPPKPEPPKPVVAAPAPPQDQPVEYNRRPQRRSSSGSNELMSVLMAILASQGGGWGSSTPGWPGGWSGPGRGGGPGGPSRGGLGRIRGGGRRRG
ncbi:MAG: hypothetical protein L0Z47_04365 [Actinobacteria bacterium]|nr:hypothetical protein [Actinomycetota bacterium]